jgi:hypothetical protein
MTTTPTPRPVESRQDRLRHATTEPYAAGDAPTFAAYLTATERDQLDARAACAEQERDEALDARDVLRAQLDAIKAEKKRLLGRLEMAEHVIDLMRDASDQQDRALAAWDSQPTTTTPAPVLGSAAGRAQDQPDLAPVIAHQWSIRYPGGTVHNVGTFTEAAARQRAADLSAEVVYRAVGPWEPAP